MCRRCRRTRHDRFRYRVTTSHSTSQPASRPASQSACQSPHHSHACMHACMHPSTHSCLCHCISISPQSPFYRISTSFQYTYPPITSSQSASQPASQPGPSVPPPYWHSIHSLCTCICATSINLVLSYLILSWLIVAISVNGKHAPS